MKTRNRDHRIVIPVFFFTTNHFVCFFLLLIQMNRQLRIREIDTVFRKTHIDYPVHIKIDIPVIKIHDPDSKGKTTLLGPRLRIPTKGSSGAPSLVETTLLSVYAMSRRSDIT